MFALMNGMRTLPVTVVIKEERGGLEPWRIVPFGIIVRKVPAKKNADAGGRDKRKIVMLL